MGEKRLSPEVQQSLDLVNSITRKEKNMFEVQHGTGRKGEGEI